MTFTEAGDALRQRLLSGWAGPLQIIWDNRSTEDRPQEGFLLTSFTGLGEELAEMAAPGQRTFREECLFMVSISIPIGSSIQLLEQYASQVKALFLPDFFADQRLRIIGRSISKSGPPNADSRYWAAVVSVRCFVDTRE